MNKSIRNLFPKSLRLLKRRQFRYVTSKGQRLFGRYIVLEKSKNNLTVTRLGITVTRRFGPSVSRNRFKRVVREAFRAAYRSLPKGFDLIVRPKKGVTDVTPEQLISELITLSSQECGQRTAFHPRNGNP